MFRSISKSFRDLWNTNFDKDVSAKDNNRKRLQPSEYQDNSDVEVICVKRPRQSRALGSSSGFFSLLSIPVNKMAEWVKKKAVGQDHVFVGPITTDSSPHKRDNAHTSDIESLNFRNGKWNMSQQESDVRGIQPVHYQADYNHKISKGDDNVLESKNRHPLSRRPSKGSFCEDGSDLDVQIIDVPPVCKPQSISSRCSSCLSLKANRTRFSAADQCFQLKEKEQFLRLLQQHTTLDLGYHTMQSTTNCQLPVRQLPRSSRTRKTEIRKFVDTSHQESFRSASFSSITSVANSSAKPYPARRRVLPLSQSVVSPSAVLLDKPSHTSYLPASLRSDIYAMPRPLHRKQTPEINDTVGQPAFPARKINGHPQVMRVPPLDGQDEFTAIDVDEELSNECSDKMIFKASKFLDDHWLSALEQKYAISQRNRQLLITEAEMIQKLLEKQREDRYCNLDKRLQQQMRLYDEEPEIIEEFPLPEVVESKLLPVLTAAMRAEISRALASGPATEVLAEGFKMKITRADLSTLGSLNWLNDEVINFYMNLLTERGGRHGYAKTYTFNTFFFQKLVSSGHQAVRRWTRSVDLFSYSYIVIPVHLDVHWCLCVVFVDNKEVCYYDSMGGSNQQCLNTVRQYLYDECKDKRSELLDLTFWASENVKEIPHQMNGSDCGVFSCMYAEALTRGAKIILTQVDMPYFRLRMVYEILNKQLL